MRSARRGDLTPIKGWTFANSGFKTFQEAPLRLSAELGEGGDPERAPLLLVSAPGAVGKSTLARQIAFRTEAVYVDLSVAGPVGDNTLSGGLLRSDLVQGWYQDRVALLIDGLDEARLRVTQEAFEAFLHDVSQLAKDRQLPTVLFGRTGAIEDTWLVLDDAAVESTVLEIGYYEPVRAREFVASLVDHSCPNDPSLSVRQRASELLLSNLLQQTEQDGNRFAGYAPVLNAVAECVISVSNPAALVSKIESGVASVTLQSVVDAILDRESTKLRSLRFDDATLCDKLYLPAEQLDRLVAHRYGTTGPPLGLAMSNKDRERYERALVTWLPEHPFLIGRDDSSPSAVFDAVITGQALGTPQAAESAAQRESESGANPFLSVFYPPEESVGAASISEPISLPAEHIGIVYSSVRARLTLSETANLLVVGRGDEMEAEISLRGSTEERHERTLLKFRSGATDTVRIGSRLADAEIDVPRGRVEIGTGAEVTLVAPIDIECEELQLTADKFVVEAAPRERFASAVVLRGQTAAPTISGTPILRPGANLSVSWPGSHVYPWRPYSVGVVETVDEERVREGLQRLRRLVTAFRARGKDQLARSKQKIDSPRMMKGLGSAVLKAMMDENIIHLDGHLYVLDASALGRVVGVNYIDCASQRWSDRAIAFVRCIVEAVTEQRG